VYLRNVLKIVSLDNRGQTTIELILPLIVVLFALVGLAYVIPMLSVTKSLALAVGMVIFIISFVRTDLALYILIFSMLLSPEFIIGSTEGASLSRGVTLRIDDFLLVIIGFSWLAKMSINKELGLFLRTPLNRPIAYYLIICLVSTLLGSVFGRVDLKTGFFFVLKYFEYMIIYFIVVNNLENKEQLRKYLWAIFITCAIVSLIGMAQIPGGERVSAPFEGEFGEPNTFGGYLVFIMSIVMGLVLTCSSGRDRFFYICLILVYAVPFIYTRSRGSYAAGIAVMFAFIFLAEKKLLVLPVFLLMMLSLPFVAPNPAKERVKYTFTQGLNRQDVVEIAGIKLDTSTSARLRSWQEASKDWIQHPILGFGVTGYRFQDAQYVRVITETGFSGLFLFFVLAGTIFRQAKYSFKKCSDNFHKGITLGFLAGFIGLLVHALAANTFIIVRIMEPFWFLTAMIVMIPELEKAGEP